MPFKYVHKFIQRQAYIRIYKGLNESHRGSLIGLKLWAIKSAHVVRAVFFCPWHFWKSFDDVLTKLQLPSLLMPAFKKWSLADFYTYWVIKPLNNALQDSHRTDAICWLQAYTSSLCLRRTVFDWNEKVTTPDTVWFQGIGGFRPVWIKLLSQGKKNGKQIF